MNGKLLYKKNEDGEFEPTTVSYCGKCGRMHYAIEEADECCVPRINHCVTCGCELPTHSSTCDACWKKARAEEEAVVYANAKKITVDEYNDDLICNGDTFLTLEDLWDELHGSPERPAYVYAVERDAFKLYEVEPSALYDESEWDSDFDPEDVPGFTALVEEINVLVDGFNDTPNECYVKDRNTVVLLDAAFWCGVQRGGLDGRL